MFRRLRQLRISLAAKCQLLFGAAVILIIGAALVVPWQRIEQLTDQLNERAAQAMADEAIARHVAEHASPPARRGSLSTDEPSATRPASLPTQPTATLPTMPTTWPAVSLPRLVSLAPRHENSEMAKFELRAVSHFARHVESPLYSAYYDRGDGTKGFRYAQPLFLTQECTRCHVPQPDAAMPATFPTTAELEKAATVPSTGPLLTGATPVPLIVDPVSRRVGIVSVDFGSRIDTTEQLLNRVFILGAGLIAGTLAIVVFYVITSRLILQPVRVLQETAEKVSRGDLNIRSDINTGDEFQQLSETFNKMLANLKQSTDQLRAVNKGLDLKLGQLAETNVGLYESNRLKSEFLANVSHELRTPLNSILGFADLLKDVLPISPAVQDGKASAEARPLRYVNNILTSGRNLLELINDLLDLAKIEAGRMEIRSEPLSLNDLFEGLTTILKPLAEQKKVSIQVAVDADVPIISSDAGKLQQVLYNFLSNAIKFSPPEGLISLSACLDDSAHVRIAVMDEGPGIDAAQHAVIFEKFRQLDGSVTRAHSGTGLGLAISKELTSLMGGSIGVRSAPAQGATFWIVLPLQVKAGEADVRGRFDACVERLRITRFTLPVSPLAFFSCLTEASGRA